MSRPSQAAKVRAAYRAANRERINAQKRTWRNANIERVKEQERKSRSRRKRTGEYGERAKAYGRIYREKNRERISELRRAWKKKWRANNPEKAREERRKQYLRHREKELAGHRAYCQTPHGRAVKHAVNKAARDRNHEKYARHRAVGEAKRLMALSAGIKRREVGADLVEAKLLHLRLIRGLRDGFDLANNEKEQGTNS